MGKIKHGESIVGAWTPEYRAWTRIKVRCYNRKQRNYHLWGGKGIKVCKEWLNSYEKFLLDMGRRPTSQHSLDRIDNNKDYSKKNCKWATKKEQNSNRSNNIIFDNKTSDEVSRELGGCRYLIRSRLKRGWSIEKAFTTPLA